MANTAAESRTFIIAGLGNPGPQYELTRHNVGFLLLDAFADAQKTAFKPETKFKCDLASVTYAGRKLFLVKPTTFMNLSGESVGKLARYYQVPPEAVLVVYDDVALPFGKVRFRPDGSDGGHNGIKSVMEHLGTGKVPRLRIGVGGPPEVMALKDYVLQKFMETELDLLPTLFEGCIQALRSWVRAGTQQTMNTYNGKLLIPADEAVAPAVTPETAP